MKQKIVQIRDVEKLSLLELSNLIAEAYSKDKTSISGAVFAYFAKELLTAETKTGGPYHDKTSDKTMPRLNATIGRLFTLMGHPLPNVDAYLAALEKSHLSRDDLLALQQYTVAQRDISHHPLLKSSNPYRLARATLESLEEPVRTSALEFLERVELADTTNEIACLAHFSAHALNANISKTKLDLLGEANIHGWIAYMIYDHIIDHEASIAMLPVANICMRLSLDRYNRVIPEKHPLRTLVAQYFDHVDIASAWELAHCRFEISSKTIHMGALPDYQQYEQLARRTMIHSIGPIIIASLTPPLAKNPQALKHLTHGLEQYLIARQLSDDIHDWREDLEAGRISAVTAYLLHNSAKPDVTTYDLTELTSTLKDDFLQQASGDISTLIISHAQRARRGLQKAGCDMSSELIGLITRLEDMATASIRQQSRFLEFQNEYQQ